MAMEVGMVRLTRAVSGLEQRCLARSRAREDPRAHEEYALHIFNTERANDLHVAFTKITPADSGSLVASRWPAPVAAKNVYHEYGK